MLKLSTLGSLALKRDGEEVTGARRKDLVLLTFLVRRSPSAASRAELATLMWGERGEERARQSLRQSLSSLRRVLGGALELDGDLVRIAPETVELDAAHFEAEVAAGRVCPAAEAWGGEFLAGLEGAGSESYREWLDAERARLHRLLDAALERWVAEAEAAGRWEEMAERASRWAERSPSLYDPRLQWVRALHLGGRTYEALARHAEFSRLLDVELVGEGRRGAEWERLLGRLESDARTLTAPANGALGEAAVPRLIGREEQFGELRALWERARNGSPSAIVVSGEEGIGKTALIDHFTRWVTSVEPDALVLRTRPVGSERLVPWSAAHELLAPLREAPGLGGASAGALAEVARLVPALRERFSSLGAATGEEHALQGALGEVLDCVAAEVPLLLVVDPMAEMDPHSARLLISLARRLPAAGLLWVGAQRSEGDVRGASALDPQELPGAHRMRLGPLEVAGVRDLLSGLLPEPLVTEELARRVHHESGGNPLYACDLAHAIAAAAAAAAEPGDGAAATSTIPTPPGEPLPLPDALRDRIARRIAALGTAAAATLDQAALQGESFDPHHLAERDDIAPAALAGGLRELLDRRIVEEDSHVPGRYRFRHPVLRRVALARMLPARGETRAAAAEPPGGSAAAGVAGASSSADGRSSPPRRGWRARNRVPLLAAVLAAGALVAALLLRLAPGPAAPGVEVRAVVAIGEIRDLTGEDGGAAGLLPDLLATNLARAGELHVVSSARMYELLARRPEGGNGPAALAVAARRAGAAELIEGALYLRMDGLYRLDLRRVRLEDGAVEGSYTAVAADPFALVDDATAQILRDHREGRPLRVADVTTRSLVAFRFYREGLAAFYQGDDHAAARLFETALQEDTSFALAAYYSALARRGDGAVFHQALERAARLAAGADDHQRLLITGMHADFLNRQERFAIAETLAVRYPAEPDGQYLLGRAKMWSGDFDGAVPHLRQVIAMDSAGAREEQPRCRACEAAYELVNAYLLADSIDAAERAARQWLAWRPGSSSALDVLANTLDAQGRFEEALAVRRSAPHQPGGTTLQLWEAIYAIRGGNFSRADRFLRVQAESGSLPQRRSALWYLTISLRYQGRYEEALRVARQYRALADDGEGNGKPPHDALLEAIVLFEAGQPRRSAALFDSLAAAPPDLGAAWNARHATWMNTHVATGLHAAGDTAALRRLIPVIREHGSRSSYGRDPRLHHHARGLLLLSRGELREAESAFREAIFSPSFGYTRTNLELGRTLLRLGRHAEAAAVLQPAFRGSLQASNLYVTYTELHEALAEVAEAAGNPGAARAHLRWVANAWAGADPPLRERGLRARARLLELERLTGEPLAGPVAIASVQPD